MKHHVRVHFITAAVLTFLVASGVAHGQLPAPKPVEPPPASKIRFLADPVSDGAILTIGLGFAALSELTISTC
jgi:hypothetical protein